jgi:PadR family transcriptional regulator, regulatory protein PadR
MINAQFKKGVLELCVMALLAQRAHYGYELVEKVSEAIEISEGTIYPLLKRLKDDGYVSTYLEESATGAPRKYYELTPKGEEIRNEITKEWITFTKRVNTFLTLDSHE